MQEGRPICAIPDTCLPGAGRAKVGMEVGVREIAFSTGAASLAPPQCTDEVRRCEQHRRIAIHEVHQDGVTRLPPGAQLLASSANCAVEAWALGSNVLGIQGAHPSHTSCADLGSHKPSSDAPGNLNILSGHNCPPAAKAPRWRPGTGRQCPERMLVLRLLLTRSAQCQNEGAAGLCRGS